MGRWKSPPCMLIPGDRIQLSKASTAGTKHGTPATTMAPGPLSLIHRAVRGVRLSTFVGSKTQTSRCMRWGRSDDGAGFSSTQSIPGYGLTAACPALVNSRMSMEASQSRSSRCDGDMSPERGPGSISWGSDLSRRILPLERQHIGCLGHGRRAEAEGPYRTESRRAPLNRDAEHPPRLRSTS